MAGRGIILADKDGQEVNDRGGSQYSAVPVAGGVWCIVGARAALVLCEVVTFTILPTGPNDLHNFT